MATLAIQTTRLQFPTTLPRSRNTHLKWQDSKTSLRLNTVAQLVPYKLHRSTLPRSSYSQLLRPLPRQSLTDKHLAHFPPCQSKGEPIRAASDSKPESRTSDSYPSEAPQLKAAFFDVDGTIAKTNIVWPYVYVRLRELPLLARLIWVPYFTTLSVFYRLADKIDRGLLCRFFYFNYRGRPVAAADEWGTFTYEEYMRPRIFQGAIDRIRKLKSAGFRIVLITGSLSFMVAPLAAEIEADDVIAADLVERDGRFTGQLAGAAFNGHDKALIVAEYAAQHGVDLRTSHAYGDSIADLGMLESVGHPHAVLPDKRLQEIAELRGWPVVTEWAIEEKPPHPLTRLWV